MSATNACSTCGQTVAEDAPRGLCPRCLMGSATQTVTGSPSKPRPPAVNRAELLRVLRELDLVSADDLSAIHDDDPAQIAQTLVQRKTLTPYQAGAILGGKARGLLIGPYLVLDKLGSGGMGLVLKAKHRSSGRIVALKMLPPSFGKEAETVRRFRREFQVASRLNHPNLVAAIEASEDRGIHYLTMEYIPGYDLDTLVTRGGPMDLSLALHCVIQAARGLEAAHAQGIIHRDVKPANLMIDPNGAVRVLDLGLARVIEATTGFSNQSGKLTQTGSYMGTVDYLSPEQANDAKAADARADIYSLACTLYFLLNAQPPFKGDTVLKRLMAHQDRPAPSLRLARPEVSEALEQIYLQMMAKRPGDRPQSMSEVVIALESCRSSAREAGDASADLKTFARTIMKRAPVRGRRGPDASVFARPSARIGGLEFDPDLCFEDLVADYREEIHHGPIPEDKLPPLPPKLRPARKKRRKRIPPALIGLMMVIVLGVIGFALIPRERSKPIDTTTIGLKPNPTASTDHAGFAESIGLKIVPIPSGEFWMGMSDEELNAAVNEKLTAKKDDYDSARPRHRVQITRLGGLSAHEVTIGQFRRFVEDTGYVTECERGGQGGAGNDPVTWKYGRSPKITWKDNGFHPSDNHPATCVNWNDAVAFCQWLSLKDGRTYRLPTEAEWEYCCRAGTETLFSNGTNTLENMIKIGNVADANLRVKEPKARTLDGDDGSLVTAPVGRFAPNAWGLYDMHGNAWEWCQDGFDASYYATSPPTDPLGPPSGSARILRGGSWYDVGVPSGVRNPFPARASVTTVGFRVALDRSPPPANVASADDFKPLFNGKDLAGWAGRVTDFEVNNGILSCKPGRRGVIYEPVERGDFAARVEFRLAPGAESGLLLRSPGKGEYFKVCVESMCEIQVLDDTHPSNANLDPRYRNGSAYGAAAAEPGHLKPLGEWNVEEVSVRGSTVEVVLNGARILKTDLATVHEFAENHPHPGIQRPRGFFAVQSGFGQKQGNVQYRKIEVRDLDRPANPLATASSFRPLFNGKDFKGWIVPDDATLYTIENGEILLKPGSKYEFLITDRSYANFVLKAKVTSSRSNTGIQIRSKVAPERQVLGVQVDIFEGGWGLLYDQEKRQSYQPYDGDKARLALKPGDWNDLEITAQDKRVVTKINGTVVTDLVIDDLPESGVIAIQPDYFDLPTVPEGRKPEPIRFKDVVIGELPGPAIPPPSPPLAGKRLYLDDFNDPSTGWPAESKKQAGKSAEHHWGYAEGTYRLDANVAAPFAWGPGNSFNDFYCEATGRVFGDHAASLGSMMVEFLRNDNARGFQVRLTNRGEVYLEQSFHVLLDYKGADKAPGVQAYGPIRNPAVHVGGTEFNRLGIRRVGRTVEVFVNGASVLGPVPLEWSGPVSAFLGVAADVPNVRAEFDRIEVRAVPRPVANVPPPPVNPGRGSS